MTTIERKSLAKEMAKDLALANTRILFDSLKALEAEGKRNSSEFATTFTKYAEAFKTVHGYAPHWAR